MQNDTKMSRRGPLAGVPAVAVAMSPAVSTALGEVHAQSGDDPVHAAIEAHREALAAFNTAIGAFGKVELSGDEDAIGEAQGDVDMTGDVEMDALDALIETVPSTPAGLCTMIDYFVDHGASSSR
jgi:hypothetical protein